MFTQSYPRIARLTMSNYGKGRNVRKQISRGDGHGKLLRTFLGGYNASLLYSNFRGLFSRSRENRSTKDRSEMHPMSKGSPIYYSCTKNFNIRSLVSGGGLFPSWFSTMWLALQFIHPLCSLMCTPVVLNYSHTLLIPPSTLPGMILVLTRMPIPDRFHEGNRGMEEQNKPSTRLAGAACVHRDL